MAESLFQSQKSAGRAPGGLLLREHQRGGIRQEVSQGVLQFGGQGSEAKGFSKEQSDKSG